MAKKKASHHKSLICPNCGATKVERLSGKEVKLSKNLHMYRCKLCKFTDLYFPSVDKRHEGIFKKSVLSNRRRDRKLHYIRKWWPYVTVICVAMFCLALYPVHASNGLLLIGFGSLFVLVLMMVSNPEVRMLFSR